MTVRCVDLPLSEMVFKYIRAKLKRFVDSEISLIDTLKKHNIIKAGPISHDSELQKLDWVRAVPVVKLYEWKRDNPTSEISKEMLDKIIQDANRMHAADEDDELRMYVNDLLNVQVQRMFEGIELHTSSVEEAVSARRRAEIPPPHIQLKETIGFELECRPSTIPNAGMGLFLRSGCISAGGVAALYPGAGEGPGICSTGLVVFVTLFALLPCCVFVPSGCSTPGGVQLSARVPSAAAARRSADDDGQVTQVLLGAGCWVLIDALHPTFSL